MRDMSWRELVGVVVGVGAIVGGVSAGDASASAGRSAVPDFGTWTSPQRIAPQGGAINGVSCVSDTFCMAVDQHDVLTFDGHRWSNPVSIDPKEQLEAVSCVSAQFCVAVAWDRSYVYDGTSWSGPQHVLGPGSSLTTLACASTTLCFATDDASHSFRFDGSRWKSFTLDPYEITALACAGPTFCVASDYRGGVMTFDGTRWSQPQGVDSTGLQSISCPSSTFCVGVDYRNAVVFDGTSWTSPELVDANGMTSVGCLSASSCVAVDRLGDAVAYDGRSWTAPSPVIQASQYVWASCAPGGNLCEALADIGWAAPYDGTDWGPQQRVSRARTSDPSRARPRRRVSPSTETSRFRGTAPPGMSRSASTAQAG